MKNRRQSNPDYFSGQLQQVPVEALRAFSLEASEARVRSILARGRANSLEDFASLLSPAALPHLEALAAASQRLTRQHYGKAIRLFAPIYLSNECVNICKYCGFSRNNDIPRITVPLDQVVAEVEKLHDQGFRSLLLVAGEHPKHVSNGYVAEVVRACLSRMPSISIELGPMETEGYRPIVEAGCEGLVVYQETYHEPTYRSLHPSGPKKHYEWRLDTAERAAEAGFRRLGIGALFGLYDWRFEALSLAAHASWLMRRCWRQQLTLSLPRMRPAAGGYQPNEKDLLGDREYVQLLCALRLFLPTVGLVLSTRESPAFRDNLFRLGITMASAGSCTEPGGYSDFDETCWKSSREQPGEQFEIADERSPAEVAASIRLCGMEAIWKDFDVSLVQ